MAQSTGLRRRRRPPPQAIDHKSHVAGLRAVALFEAFKGVIVLLVEIGLLSLLHKDAGAIAESFVRHLHINPEQRFAHTLLHAAGNMTDARLWALAGGAAAYATVRFVEAYGLWHARVWAEWFALLSGTLYLPWELYELVDKRTPLRWAVLLANLAIIAYMLYVRIDACRPGEDCEPNQE